jgi:hypothetical protein
MKKILMLLGLMVIFSSCSNDEINNEVELNEVENVKVLREISLLIGETLKNQEVRNEILETVDEVDSYGNAVSFALLLGENSKTSDYEKRKMGTILNKTISGKSESLFKAHLNNIYSSNKEKYAELNKTFENNPNILKRTNLSELESYLIENELELYFPYKDKFDWEHLISYTVTFEDENPNGSYEGFKYLGLTYEEVSNIIDDYLFENPTVAIIPMDKDYVGEDLRISYNNQTHYLNPNLSFQHISDFYDNLYGGGNFGSGYAGSGSTGGGSTGGGNTGTTPQRIRLTQNVNPYTFFNENHILTNYIPKVRITTTSWKRTLSKAHRTRIARAGSTVAVNPNGTFSAMTNTFYFDFDISASDLRNKRWKNVGIMFDPNWHKTKGSQQIIVWTKRSNASNSSLQVKNEIKIDAQGNYTPNTSISATFNASSETKAIFRGNVELDRDQVLTTIVNGSEYDNATHNHNGANLSVRRVANNFEYIFDLFYTNL